MMKPAENPPARTNDRDDSLFGGYAPGEDVPLGGYATLIAVFGGVMGALLASKRLRESLPEKISADDVVLLGLATHRLTRVVAKDWVTAPVRAPFTRYVGSEGGGEVEEEARGSGLRKATGQLISCRFCAGPWVAMSLVTGFVLRPKATRMVATIFSVAAVSDFFHHIRERLEKE